MILEVIAEVILPSIGRAVGYIIFDILGQIIFYSTGYLTLKAVTFGKYPENYFPKNGDTKKETYVIIIGIVVWMLGALVGYTYFGGYFGG